MSFLTTEQRERIKACWSGMRADLFLELSERGQNVFINKLDDVVLELIKENPDAFRGSVVQRVYMKRRIA